MDWQSALWIILVGALVAGSAGLVGCFLVLRRMAMLGDAISHAVLPGIALAFLFSGTKATLPMLIGAGALGILTTFLVQLLERAGVQEDAGMGVVFTALFAVGVILISAMPSRVHLDLDHVLFGEIAYTPLGERLLLAGLDLGPQSVWVMGLIFLLNAVVISLFYKELKLSSFDPQLAAAVGINVALVHYILMALVSITTVGAFESVGAILVVAMLIVPGATAYLLTERLAPMLLLSVLLGAASSLLGYLVAAALDSSIAASMTAVSGLLFLCAFLFSPQGGLVGRLLVRRKLQQAGEEQ